MAIEQSRKERPIYTIDLEFGGACGVVAAYLIPHDQGAILIETGSGSTLPALQAGLRSHGVMAGDITDVLVTHIHLDHAGASGWLARQGARIHVHANGAHHLVTPEKLLASATRIYGDKMQALWGEFLPVPENRIIVQEDEDVIEIGGLTIKVVETPGHASHHFAYIFQEVCFTGDIGGVRMAGTRYLRLPMPPPDLNLELWRRSAKRLWSEYSRGAFRCLALTHFGIFEDPDWHLSTLEQTLDEVEEWASTVMPSDPSIEEICSRFVNWERRRMRKAGVENSQAEAIDSVNASWMSACGLQRYWQKIRNTPKEESIP
jgi:glyoxylase-like metal-dependent hydrolase (beta-lactamase superfamily II)